MIAVVFFFYLGIQFVCIGTLPNLAESKTPLADAAGLFLGNTASFVITIGALISITGTLNSIMLTGPRALFAMAENKQLPGLFKEIHNRFHTPHISILLSGGIVLILTLWGDFISSVKISTLIRLITYAVTCLSVPILRRKKNLDAPFYRMPLGNLITFLSLILIVWLVTNTSWQEIRDLGITAVIGLILFYYNKISRKKSYSKKL